MENKSPEQGEQAPALNVFRTEDKEGRPTTIVESGHKGRSRIIAEFGRDGFRFCNAVSDRIHISSGDAIIKSTLDNEPGVVVREGVPTTEKITLEEAKLEPIDSILVKTEGVDDGFFNLLNRVDTIPQVYEAMSDLGIQMSRAEAGVLSHRTDYTFMVGKESEVVVNAGDRKYLKSEGRTYLNVTKGTVFINTLTKENKKVSVIVRIV